MKQRGAGRVLGIDMDDRYLNQARFAAATLGMDIEFQKRSVYDVDQIGRTVRLRVLHGRLVSSSLSACSRSIKWSRKSEAARFPDHDSRFRTRQSSGSSDYDFWNKEILQTRIFRRCTSSRTATPTTRPTGGSRIAPPPKPCCAAPGLEIVDHPETETWICEPQDGTARGGKYILDHELAGTLLALQ